MNLEQTTPTLQSRENQDCMFSISSVNGMKIAAKYFGKTHQKNLNWQL